MSTLLHRLLGGGSAEEVRRALRARPELQEAVAVTRKALQLQPELDDWILARAGVGAVLEIDAKLSGGLERETARLEMYRGKGRAAGTP